MPPTSSLHNNPHFPVLYTEILDIIFSYLENHRYKEQNHLLACAQVCKNWTPLARKHSFASIEDIHVLEYPILQDLLQSFSGRRPAADTFTKHIKSASLLICPADFDESTDASKLIELIETYFPAGYQLSLAIVDACLRYQHLAHFRPCTRHIVTLLLSNVTVNVEAHEFDDFVCDSSMPSLKTWRIEGTQVGPGDSPPESEAGNITSRESKSPLDRKKQARFLTRTLDELFVSNDGEFDHHLQFWPCAFVTTLIVTRRLGVLLKRDYERPLMIDMLERLAPDLVELDICDSKTHYEGLLSGPTIVVKINFPKLQVLRLCVTREVGYSESLGSLFSQLYMPSLQTVVLRIEDPAHVTQAGLDLYEHPILWLNWIELDEAVSSLARTVRSLGEKLNHGNTGLTKLVVSVFLEGWPEWRSPPVVEFVQQQFPESISEGLDVEFEPNSRSIELDFNGGFPAVDDQESVGSLLR